MIDPLLSLAFSMYSSPGAYALLLGSGVSRSARVPTGYEVTLDLLRKVASLQNADAEPDLPAWYERTHGASPTYSGLLAELAKTPTERNALLRGYFEPSEQEATEGIKTPTVSHKAIAELMAGGYVRVVITTNFDRLLERALEAAGVMPTVISTADGAKGALPLTHAKATIVKINGDYLDTRIRNTVEELSDYEPPMTALLDRIIDEFGLVVCGWSGDWDVALRAAIERAPNRRFTTYWCARGEPSEAARSLIALRGAAPLKIESADSFFEGIKDKVLSLRELSREHPLSPVLAVQTVKKYILLPKEFIKLHDLVLRETEKVHSACSAAAFPFNTPPSPEEVLKRASRYEAITDILCAIFGNGCYWGTDDHCRLWVKALRRLGSPPTPSGQFFEVWQRMSLYPCLLALYAGGIGSIAAKKYSTFSSLSWQPMIRSPFRSDERPLALSVNTDRVVDGTYAQGLNPGQNLKTPTSVHLFSVMRPLFAELLPDDAEFQRAFDEFEYIFCLTIIHDMHSNNKLLWFPLGCFAWRYGVAPTTVIDQISIEVEKMREKWAPLQAGLFGGSLQAFKDAVQLLQSSERFQYMLF